MRMLMRRKYDGRWWIGMIWISIAQFSLDDGHGGAVMLMRRGSADDDIPHAVLGMSTDESLGAVASIQQVDTSKPLPPLNRV